MSGEALGWARRQKVSGGLVAKAVLLLLADYCGEDHDCWPSVPTLAAELDAHERTVQRALASLEADRLIEREARSTGKGRSTSNRIRLDVLCEAGGLSREAARAAAREGDRGGAAPPPPPAQRHPRGGTAPPLGVAQRHPQNLQLEPPLEPSSADAEDAGARERADAEVEAWFVRFMAAYPQSGREKTDWAQARTAFAETALSAWAAAGEDRSGGEVLTRCAETYAASGTLARGTFGAVNAVKFLIGERWRAFLPGTAAAQAVAAAAPVTGWAGPAEVWAAVCADRRLGEDWAAAWLGPCAVVEGVVHPRTGVAADRLRGTIGGLLAEHGLKIGDVRKGEG